jgi:hypothetical protein
VGLVEFLADLRHDLARAQEQAAAAAELAPTSGGGRLWLGVDEVTVTLDVAHERTLSGETSGKASGATKRVGTQTLTLTLKPRVDTTVTDAQGRSVTTTHGVDVSGQLAAGEQPPPPQPSPAPGP